MLNLGLVENLRPKTSRNGYLELRSVTTATISSIRQNFDQGLGFLHNPPGV